MNYFFVGSLYPKNQIKEIRKNSKKSLDNAANNLQWSLVKGLELFSPTHIFTAPVIRSYPFGYKSLKINNSEFRHGNNSLGYLVGFLNISLLKLISKRINLQKLLNEKVSQGKKTIFVYSVHSPFLGAVYSLKKHHKDLTICLIVPDLPEYMSGSKNLIYRGLKKIDSFLINRYLKAIDCFVLLSDYMKEPLKVEERPYVVVEGILNNDVVRDLQDIEPNDAGEKKIILYTGTLAKRYGILNLLEAFSSIDKKEYELWICGSGNTADLIKLYAEKDTRINYFGLLPHEEVIKLQKKATVLVNPRTSEGEFTKYSFPSKIIEYLGSGTPTIMHRLPGIPEEYYGYCYVAEDENSYGLQKKILEVCENNNQTELKEFGRKAQNFVIENKNAKSQVEKIITMIENKLS